MTPSPKGTSAAGASGSGAGGSRQGFQQVQLRTEGHAAASTQPVADALPWSLNPLLSRDTQPLFHYLA